MDSTFDMNYNTFTNHRLSNGITIFFEKSHPIFPCVSLRAIQTRPPTSCCSTVRPWPYSVGRKYEAAEGNCLKEANSDFRGENYLDTKFTSKLQMLQRGFCAVKFHVALWWNLMSKSKTIMDTGKYSFIRASEGCKLG